MEDTGRIRRVLGRRARRIAFGDAFGDDAGAAIRGELPRHVRIDRAHLVMRVDAALVPGGAG